MIDEELSIVVLEALRVYLSGQITELGRVEVVKDMKMICEAVCFPLTVRWSAYIDTIYKYPKRLYLVWARSVPVLEKHGDWRLPV